MPPVRLWHGRSLPGNEPRPVRITLLVLLPKWRFTGQVRTFSLATAAHGEIPST
jgi:hypothetical protein